MGSMICPTANAICFSLYFATILQALPMYQVPCSSTVDSKLGSHPGRWGAVVSTFWEKDKVVSKAQELVLESSSQTLASSLHGHGASLEGWLMAGTQGLSV